jgi:hypothetical protein
VAVSFLAVLPAHTDEKSDPAFRPLFNGKDLSGWKVMNGRMDRWGAENGLLFVQGGGGGWLMTEKEFTDFELRLEYKMPPGGNSGVALRSPLAGDPAYSGMEIQLLDDNDPRYANLQKWQYTGSIYGVVAPSKRVVKPAGEWNAIDITAKGRQITVVLNGEKIVDANLNDHAERVKEDKEKKLPAHPGIARTGGHLGLQSHDGRVEFRNIAIKVLGEIEGKPK